jgi:hypothetical protein
MTVASYQGDAYPLRLSEGDVFYQNLGYYSWIQIVEVNPLPRGASFGELGKNLSPSKSRSSRICEYVPEYVARSFVAGKHS